MLVLLALSAREAVAVGALTDLSSTLGWQGPGGSAGPAIGGGVAWFDADGDGDLDLALVGPSIAPVLFLSASGGWVLDEAALVPATAPLQVGGIATFDMDGDDDNDVLLLRPGPDALLRNDGKGKFTDVSAWALPGEAGWSVSAAPGDVDGDGDVDVYVGNYIDGVSFPAHFCQRNVLLINDGTGRFTDRAVEFGVDGRGCTLAVAMADVDRDGDLDLLAVNDFGMFTRSNELYRNDGPTAAGGWTFADVSESSGFAQAVYGMGLALTDLDDDGQVDLFATSIGRGLLQTRTANGAWQDVTEARGARVEWADTGYQTTWGTLFEDLDGDGWVDLFVSGGHIPATAWLANPDVQPNVVLRGSASGVFSPPPATWTIATVANNDARGVAAADWDGDGDPDLAQAQADGRLTLLRNDAPVPAGALCLRATATATAPSAVGLEVTATCGGLARRRWVTGGGSFASATVAELRFVFPPPCHVAGQVVDLTLRWPSGYTELKSLVTGALYSVTEPAWVTVGASSVQVTPSTVAGAVTSVVLEATGATLGPTTTIAPGTYAADIVAGPAEGTEALVTVRVNGKALPVHPRLRTPSAAPRLWTVPAFVRPGAAYAWVVEPHAPDGALLGPGHTITVSTPGTSAVTAVGDGLGRYVAKMPAPSLSGTVVAKVTLDGALLAQPTLEVLPLLDLTRSFGVLGELYLDGGAVQLGKFRYAAFLRDHNDLAVTAEPGLLTITANGVPVDPLTFSAQAGEAIASAPGASFPAGTVVTLAFAGQTLAAPAAVQTLNNGAAYAQVISPSRSLCGVSMATMRADGQDALTVTLQLRDSGGHPVKAVTSPILVGKGVSLIPDSLATHGDGWMFRVRAGVTPGPATIEPHLYGVPTGVVCRVTLVAPDPLPVPDATTSSLTVTPDTVLLGSGYLSVIEVQPRSSAGRLVGSGLVLEATTTLGEVTVQPFYRGFGRYEAVVSASGAAGTGVVTVSAPGTGFALSAPLTVVDVNAPPEPAVEAGTATEPVAEAGAEAGAEAVTGAEFATAAEAVTETEPVTEVEPVAESVAETVAEPVAEPVTEAAPVAEPVAAEPVGPPEAAPAPDVAVPPDSALLGEAVETVDAAVLGEALPASDAAPESTADIAPESTSASELGSGAEPHLRPDATDVPTASPSPTHVEGGCSVARQAGPASESLCAAIAVLVLAAWSCLQRRRQQLRRASRSASSGL